PPGQSRANALPETGGSSPPCPHARPASGHLSCRTPPVVGTGHRPPGPSAHVRARNTSSSQNLRRWPCNPLLEMPARPFPLQHTHRHHSNRSLAFPGVPVISRLGLVVREAALQAEH